MACHYRIAVDGLKTSMGLPEVMLGVLPGGGGTQRLPALTGVLNTLDMALTGKTVNAKKAKKLGLVDAVVDPLGPGLTPADVTTHKYLENIAINTACTSHQLHCTGIVRTLDRARCDGTATSN